VRLKKIQPTTEIANITGSVASKLQKDYTALAKRGCMYPSMQDLDFFV
jgi:hypothetical protein